MKGKTIMGKRKRTSLKRAMAFLLTFAMGVMPAMSSATVHASEQEMKVAVETATKKVTAEDITKDISDQEFVLETSLEGIHYNPEEESVTVTSMERKDGAKFQSGMPGVYVASYLVVPKDKSASYTIQRTITLTDTEGMAHDENNGGHQEKTDTDEESDEDSQSQEQEVEVEVTSNQKEDTKETLKALEQDIEDGEVMMFSSADEALEKGSKVHLVKGERIDYPSNVGNYFTCWFWVNGKLAYCIESHKSSPPTGDYVSDVLETNKNLQKVLYYGYGGAGDITGSYMPSASKEVKYVFTHIAASYAYAGTDGFAGCDYDDLVSSGVIAYIDKLFGMEEPPKGELSFSNSNVITKREGNVQRTANIKLNGDHRNQITMQLPNGITGVNVTKGVSTSGALKISGGDTFYLQAPLDMTGSYQTGKLYGSIRETWRTLVVTTGNSKQDIGVFESETAAPVELSVKWLDMARISLVKKDADTKNPLAGAVYGIYKDKGCTDLLMKMSATNADGKAVSDYFDAGLKTVYVKEITAPENYVENDTVYTVNVKSGKTVNVEAEDKRVKGELYVRKVDVETGAFLPQGDATLEGAVYGLYAKEDIVHPDEKTGVLFPKGTLIAQKTFGKEGTISFKDLYLGEMYVKEITPPEGYTLDTTEYDATLSYAGQEKEVVTRERVVEEQVKKQAFSLIKISEDGEQTETDLVEGVGFKVYLISDLSKVKDGSLKPQNGSYYTAEDFKNYDFRNEKVAVTYEHQQPVPVPELFTDKKGYLVSPELPYGAYVVEESTVPENLIKVNPFVVNVTEDSREPMVWRVFDDRPFQFLLKIIKKDAQTENVVLGKEASYKIYDCDKKEYVEQTIYYPKKQKISVFTTNKEGYLLTPEKLKCGTYRIEEVKAPEGFVRNGNEMVLVDGKTIISPLNLSQKGSYEKRPQDAITITIGSDGAYETDPDTGVPIISVVQKNDEQVGSLTIIKTGEQLKAITGDSLVDKVKGIWKNIRETVAGEDWSDKIFHEFKYEEDSVVEAEFEVRAKEDIVSPDGAVDENGNPILRYQKDDLVATLVTDENGKATLNNLPLGSYYVKETVAGENFVLNTEEKEFTLSCEDDTATVTYAGVAYKNERQKIRVSLVKYDSVTEKPLSDVVFGLYTNEDILSQQGEVLIEKDSLVEQKRTDEEGKLTFSSDLYHGKYYVKELKQKPGYLPNDEIWEIEASYEDQNLVEIVAETEIKNQPTETQITKTDMTTGKELSGAKLQIIDKDGNVVEEWISTDEAHVVYALPEGEYILHEELAPFEDGYVTAEDVTFTVKEDGSVTKVEMKDDVSKLEIIKTDITTGEELPGAKLQVIGPDGTVLDEWVTDGTPHRIEKLPVGVELTLREISAPDGYEIAEDVKFTLEDTAEVQKVEMKDARTPVPSVPKTGDLPWKPIGLIVICVISAMTLTLIHVRSKKQKKVDRSNETKEK